LNENKDYLLYDTTHGGIITKDGLEDFGADFGNGIYNDHHFHYGYHIYAAATIGKTRPQFLE
jgi:endo-1,3(4)-beta-glucanase